MTHKTDGPEPALDPRGLIRESFRIDGIGAAECRSIFLDWALSLDDGADAEAMRAELSRIYAAEFPGHPMTQVLREGSGPGAGRTGRRGGARARRQG
ncbi:MAG: hypothetical protein ACWA5A_04190 [Marinibacterium sp.]